MLDLNVHNRNRVRVNYDLQTLLAHILIITKSQSKTLQYNNSVRKKEK